MRIRINIIKVFLFFVFSIIPIFYKHITAFAYMSKEEIGWRNLRASSNVSLVFNSTEAVRVDSPTASTGAYKYYWNKYFTFDLSFRFAANSSIFPYSHTYVDYRFFSSELNSILSGSGILSNFQFTNFVADYTFNVNGTDFAMEYPVGFIERDILSPLGVTTVVTVTVHCSGYVRYETTSYNAPTSTPFRTSYNIPFVMELIRWDCYDYTDDDILYQINRKIDELSTGDVGIEGAINNQTDVIQQGNQIQQGIKDELSSSGNIDNTGMQAGFNDYQQSEDKLLSDSMLQLDSVNFDASLPSNLGAGMVAAFTFISSLMERLYLLTDFGALFNISAVLLLACLLVGLRRLWR